MDKPLYGSVLIKLFADDVPGKMLDEQAEVVKEREFQWIKNTLAGLLALLPLEDNWETRVVE